MPKACCTLSHINCGLRQKGKQQHRAEKQEAESKQYQKSPVHTSYRRFHHGQDKNPLCPPFSMVYFASFSTDCPPFLFTLYWELPLPSLFPPESLLYASHFSSQPEPEREKRHIVSLGKLCWFWEIKFHKKVCFHEAHLRYTVLPSSLSSITGDTNVVGSLPYKKRR